LNIQQPGLPSDFGPDKVDAFEVGVKSRLLDRRLTLNVALFRNNWRDIQVNEVIGGLAALTNGPKAYSQGLEVEAQARPAAGLTLGWSFALTDAKADDDAPGVNANRGGISDGDRLPGVARFTSSAQVRYERELAADLNGYVQAEHRYFSGAYNGFDRANVLVKRIPEWNLVNLRAGVQYQQYEATVFVENLLDADNITNVSFNGGFQRDSIARVRPRSYGLTVRAGF
jgi:iron complex outermembrane recepter protein